jgi:hypothetical protein
VYNDKRREIWKGFSSFLNIIRPIQGLDLVYIDGSFVTDNEEPNDIDVVIEYPDFNTLVRLQNDHFILSDRKHAKKTYKVDMFPFLPQLSAGANDLREFFQYLRPQEALDRGLPLGSQKGILKLSMRA